MNDTATVEREEIINAVDDLLEHALSDDEVRRAAHVNGDTGAVWRQLSDVGLFSMCVPVEHNGLGFDLSTLAGVARCLGKRLTPGPVIEQLILVALLIPVAEGNARQILASAAEGTTKLAFVDPEANSFTASSGKPELISGTITGSVDVVRFGEQADTLVVIVGTDTGPSVVLVDPRAPGVDIAPISTMDPLSKYARVSLTDVDAFEVISEDGTETPRRIRSALRAAFSFELTGLSRSMLDSSVLYTKGRTQFGRPIGSFQAVQHILADLCADQLALEALCEDTASAGLQQLNPTDSLVLKALSSDIARKICEGALQVHGGVGFTDEYDLHRWVLHALALEGHYGDTSEISHALGTALLDGSMPPWQ